MRSRHGVTFLEVVLSVSLLAMVAGVMVGANGFARASQARSEVRLASAELAHRLVVMHLDDPRSVPSASLPVEYGERLYRFRLDEEQLRLVPLPGSAQQAGNAADRFSRLTVTVWLAPESGGTYGPGENGSGAVTLQRVYDRLPMRNNDSLRRMLDSDRGIREMLDAVSGRRDGGR